MSKFDGTIGLQQDHDKYVVDNKSEIPYVQPVQQPVDYPRSEARRKSEGTYAETDAGDGCDGTDTGGF